MITYSIDTILEQTRKNYEIISKHCLNNSLDSLNELVSSSPEEYFKIGSNNNIFNFINTYIPEENTIMFQICQKGFLQVCQWLHKYGDQDSIRKPCIYKDESNIFGSKNYTTERLETPMSIAIEFGNLEICKWLYDMGAKDDINRVNNFGQSTVFLACKHGHIGICEWLLNNGASRELLNRPSDIGNSPMMISCYHNQISSCEWLKKEGAIIDLKKTNKKGDTLMLFSAQQGNLKMCKWLLKNGTKTDIFKANNDGDTPMLWACIKGNISLCQWLYNVGAKDDIFQADKNCHTPMSVACYYGHISIAQWLYENGPRDDIVNVNKSGCSPFKLSIYGENIEGNFSICKWLISKGALTSITPNEELLIDRLATSLEIIFLRSSIKPKQIQNSGLFKKLFTWSEEQIGNHSVFSKTVLSSGVLVPSSDSKKNPSLRCKLSNLPTESFRLIGDFLDIKRGEELKNIRLFYMALTKLMNKHKLELSIL